MTVERYTLAELTHEVRCAIGQKRCRIWSGEHGAYWRTNAAGYTRYSSEAGVYTIGEAWRHAGHCGPEKKIEFEVVQ